MASYVFMKLLESSARRYDVGINILSLGQADKVKREIAEKYISASDRVLEIGCGTGTLAILCAQKGASVTAFDICSDMLDVARKKIQKNNLADRIQVKQMGAIEMDTAFDDETFDRIVGTLVFSELYCDEQKQALRESCRILKHGGLIIIADETKPNSLVKQVLHLLVRVPLAIITYVLTQTSTKALSDMEGLLSDAGFEMIHWKRGCLDSFGLYVARKGWSNGTQRST